MLVKELRKALRGMPGEMPVYLKEGTGITSAKHIYGNNLVRMEQFCELINPFETHTECLYDTRIESETGFKNRDELIAAYKAIQQAELERQIEVEIAASAEIENAKPATVPTPLEALGFLSGYLDSYANACHLQDHLGGWLLQMHCPDRYIVVNEERAEIILTTPVFKERCRQKDFRDPPHNKE